MEHTAAAAGVDATKLVGGKLSVGRLSDAFNILQQALVSGARDTGDAFATGLELMMQQINKSLATKHGTGDLEGPLELIDSLRQGQDLETGKDLGLAKIFKGMDAGGPGTFGEIGRVNDKYRKEIENQLMTQSPTELGMEAVKQGILKEGETVDASNFDSVIKSLVDSLDLKAQFRKMWQLLKNNMQKTLAAEGMNVGGVESAMATMMADPKDPGLDLFRMQDPAYAMTRKRGAKQTAANKGGPEGIGREILRAILSETTEDVTTQMDEFELDTTGIKSSGNKLSAEVESWLDGISSMFDSLDEKLLKAKGIDPKTAMGGYAYKPDDPTGGRIQISERNRLRPARASLGALKKIESGDLEATPKLIRFITKSLAELGMTLAHERIHEGSKKVTDSVDLIADSLLSNSTVIGQASESIFKGANKLQNVRIQDEKLTKLKEIRDAPTTPEDMASALGAVSGIGPKLAQKIVAEFGSETLGVMEHEPERLQSIPGIGSGKMAAMSASFREQASGIREQLSKRTVPTDDPTLKEFHGKDAAAAAGAQSTKYLRLVAEEIQAHLTNPEKWQAIFGDIPAEAAVAISKALDSLMGASPELVAPILDAVSGMNNAIVDTYAQALRGEGSDAAAQVRAQAEANIDANSFGMGPARKRIGQFEAALAAGREARGLTPATEDETGRIKRMRPVSFAHEKEMPDTTGEMRKILDRMAEPGAALDVDARAADKTSFQRHASSYKEGLKSTDSAKDAWKLHKEAMQEFQAAELEMFVNKSRDLQDSIAIVKNSDMADSSELDALIKELEKTMDQMYRNMSEARLPGTFGVSNISSDRRGMMTPQADELGIGIGAGQYTDVIKQARGRGEENEARFGNLSGILEDVKNGLKEDMTFTEAWVQIWDELVKQPLHMRENLGKVAEALGPMAQFMKMEQGPDKATQALQDLGQQAKQTQKELQAGSPVTSMDDLNNKIARSSRLQGAANMGRPLGEVYEKEMDRIKAEARAWVKELNEILSSGVEIDAKRLSLGSREIIDPKTGTVLRKMEVGAKRVGNQFEVSMTQAGKSVNQMTGAMRGALRRVVQWGFATGIVYGTIRAFRAAASAITEVETKITALKKVMDTSVTNFRELQDGAVGFAQEFGVSIEDVLDGMVVYGQQGLKVNKIMERTRATMLAVNVTTLSAVDATEALTASHKVFGEEMSSSIGFVDAWAAVAARHAITAKDLADAVKRSGAAAGVAGVGFNDFLGVVTAIGAVTRQTGKEIATSTKFMFRAMRRPTAQKELGKMGVQSLTPGGDFKPALGILKELAGQWDGLTRAQQVNLAQAMAGIRHYNSFIVLMNNFDEALLASADAANSQGFAMRKNRLAMGTFSKNMSQLQETAKGLAITLGNALLPVGTTIIEMMTNLGSAVGALPSIVLQSTAVFAAMGLALHKGADLISDSMEAMSTGNIGIDADKMSLGRKIGGGFKSMGEGWKAAGAVGDAARGAEGLTTLGKGAFYASRGLQGLAAGAAKAIPGLRALQAALGLGAIATGGIVLVALAAAVMGAAVAYQHLTKSAKQYEQEQEKIIGQSEDAASKLRSQKTSADRLTLAYHKIGKAQDAMNDPAALQAALQEGRFKSSAKAAQDYANMLAEVSNSMAQLDPTKVRGITETGDYVLGISDNFKALTTSALDARNAITMAMKLDVIEKFSEELHTAEGFADNLTQGILDAANAVTGGRFDIGVNEKGEKTESPIGKLSAVRKEIQKITEEMRIQEQSGDYSIEGQLKLNKLVAHEVELRGEVAATASNIRRILESMPKFEDMDMAMGQISEDAFKNIQGAAGVGAFGRGSTGLSVMNQFAADQAGLGGILDYQATQSAPLAAGAFLERGIKGRGGAEAVQGTDTDQVVSGEMAVLSQSASKALRAQFAQIDQDIRIVWSDISDTTGEVMYKYVDSTTGAWKELSGSAIEGVVRGLDGAGGSIADHWMRFTTKEVEAASEATKKMLTLQFTGAMAGIRVPTGGMPDLGPSRAAELTAEQRVMKAMPEDLQRLADVQQEFNPLAKEYSEDVLNDVEGAYKRQAKSGTAFKVMTQEILQLATRLQTEGHLITVIGNFQKVSADLAMTLEAAAEAARDANREEDNRAKFLKITSGALAGMGQLPNLDLGKSMRELSGQERLARANPAVEKMMRKIAGTERKRDSDLQVLNDLQSQMAKFDQSVIDMAKAGEELSSQQKERISDAALKDATPGELKMIEALMKEGTESRDIMGDQLSAQHQMLEKMDITNDLLALPVDERAEKFEGLIAKAGFKRQSTGFMEQAGGNEWRKLIESNLGISNRTSADAGERSSTADTAAQQIKHLVELFNALDVVSERNPDSIDSGPLATAGGKSFGKMSEVQDAINALVETIHLGDLALAESFQAAVVKRTSSSTFKEELKKKKIEESESQIAKYRVRMAELSTKIKGELADAETKQIASLEAANKALQAKEGFRLAVAVSDFAKSLSDIVLEMEKATMMGEGVKIDSDLDPDFGRVGQPGFKSSFDQRREALKAGSNRPMSLDEMRQRDTDRKQLKFDEEEAKIKKKQAVETAALKQIQQQAEKVRDILATTALDPSLDQGTRNMAQGYFDQLSEELTTSEQAVEQRDGTLKFKGVPVLNELKKFAAQMKKRSEDKAAEAASASVKKGVSGVETKLDTQITVQKAMLAALTGGRGADFVEAPDTGTSTTAAGTHSQGVGTPRVDFSAGSATRQGTTGGGDLRREGLTSQFLKEVQRVYGPKHATEDSYSSRRSSRTMGETDLATGEGANIAGGLGLAAVSLSLRQQVGVGEKAAAVFDTVLGRVVNSIEETATGIEAVTRLNGKVVGSQEFSIDTDADGVKRARAGHIGEHSGLPDEIRGKGIGKDRAAMAARALQKKGVQEILSTGAISDRVPGGYRAMAEAVGGEAAFTPGTKAIPAKGGGGYVNTLDGEAAMKVTVPPRKGKYQGLTPEEMKRVKISQGEDFYQPGRQQMTDMVDEAIASRTLSDPQSGPSRIRNAEPGPTPGAAQRAAAGVRNANELEMDRNPATRHQGRDPYRGFRNAGGAIETAAPARATALDRSAFGTVTGDLSEMDMTQGRMGISSPLDTTTPSARASKLTEVAEQMGLSEKKLSAMARVAPEGLPEGVYAHELVEPPKTAKMPTTKAPSGDVPGAPADAGRASKYLKGAGGALAVAGSALQGSTVGAGGYQAAYGKTEEERRAGTAEATGGLFSILGGAAGGAASGFGASLATANPWAIGAATLGGGIAGGTAAHYGGSSLAGVIDERTGGAYTSQVGDVFGGRGADAISPTLMSMGDRFADVGQSDPNSIMGVASNYWGKKTEDVDVSGAMSWLTGLTGLGGTPAETTAAGAAPTPKQQQAVPKSAGPKTRQQYLDQMKADMGDKAFSEVGTYTDDAMATMGTTGPGTNTQFFGSSTSRASGSHISAGASGKSRIPMSDLGGPGTLISKGDLAGGPMDTGQESLNLNEYLQRMKDSRAVATPQVGPTNNQLQTTIDATNDRTQATTTTASSPEQRDTARELESTRASDSEGNESLVKAIEGLNDKLDGLSDIKIDTAAIETAISTGSATVVQALAKDLSVAVKQPLEVSVSNFPVTTAEATAGPISADVTQLATVVSSLAGLTELHQADIAAQSTRIGAVEDVNTTQGDNIATLQTDTQGLDANSITTQITSEIATAQTSIQGEVNDSLVDIIGKVDNNATLLNTVEETANETATTVSTFEESIKTASDTAIEAKNTADETKVLANETKEIADAATITATNAQTAATAATDAITKINERVDRNRQTTITEVAAVKDVTVSNKKVGTDNTKSIGELRTDLNTVRGTADSANARVNAPR